MGKVYLEEKLAESSRDGGKWTIVLFVVVVFFGQFAYSSVEIAFVL
jgi:hypothetical protein